jgi:hypothetical protein
MNGSKYPGQVSEAKIVIEAQPHMSVDYLTPIELMRQHHRQPV